MINRTNIVLSYLELFFIRFQCKIFQKSSTSKLGSKLKESKATKEAKESSFGNKNSNDKAEGKMKDNVKDYLNKVKQKENLLKIKVTTIYVLKKIFSDVIPFLLLF